MQPVALKNDRFETLDSWRGICALLVALLHFQVNSHLQNISFFQNSYLFVDFFFVLSGFVIAANYQERLATGFGIGRFMLLRFGRLYPLYGFMLLAFVGFEFIQVLIPSLGAMGATVPFSAPRQSFDTIFSSFFLLQSFGLYDFLTWNTPGWSIATEFWTYLIFAVIMATARHSLVQISTALLLFCILAIYKFSPNGMNTTFDFGMLRCVAGFSAGVIVFCIWQRWGQFIEVTRAFGTALELCTIALVVGFVATLGSGSFAVLAPIVFSLTVLIFAAEAGSISAVLRTKFFLLLGTLSYSIYLLHLFIQTRILNFGQLVQSKFGLSMFIEGEHDGVKTSLLGINKFEGDFWCVAMIVMLIIASELSYKIIEVPGRNFFRTLASRKSRQLALQ